MQVKDAAAIKRWRTRRTLSQRDLAFLARCSQTTIYMIEKGELRNLSEDLAMEIARRLDVPWEDLFAIRENAGVRHAAHGASAARRPAEAVA